MVAHRDPVIITGSSLPTWEHAVGKPSPVFQGVVGNYSGYYQNLEQLISRLHVPMARTMLILAVGDDLGARPVRRRAATQNYQSFVIGIDAQPYISEHCGERYCIGVPLMPGAAQQLFRGAAPKFAHTTIALEDLWGKDARRLEAQLGELPGWADRFALVDRVLTTKIAASQHTLRPEILWAWQQIESYGGCISMRELARQLGWSDRHFIQQFRQQIGIPPKAAARQIRFAHAHQLLRTTQDQSLSQIALACGYSDQSHFTHEFHAFSGCPPATYQNAKAKDFPGISADIIARQSKSEKA